jgi:hypothetical protein
MPGGSGRVSAGVFVPVVDGSSSGGADEQPDKVPRMASDKAAAVPLQRVHQALCWNINGWRESCMGLILLEALLALVVLVAIVWWTMFSGRRKGELPPSDDHPS